MKLRLAKKVFRTIAHRRHLASQHKLLAAIFGRSRRGSTEQRAINRIVKRVNANGRMPIDYDNLPELTAEEKERCRAMVERVAARFKAEEEARGTSLVEHLWNKVQAEKSA